MPTFAPAFDPTHKRFESLSLRQRETALLLADGLTNVQIAERLGVTVHTVKAHRAEVMCRMQAHSFAELINQVLRIRPTETSPESLQSSPLRIIVVEDDQWYRDYLTDNLTERGFMAIGVADGADFRTAWVEQPADIVMLDIELGNGKENGLMIASELLANTACGVIVVSAKGALDDRITGLSIGVDAYFSKPVHMNELVISITNLGRRLRRLRTT